MKNINTKLTATHLVFFTASSNKEGMDELCTHYNNRYPVKASKGRLYLNVPLPKDTPKEVNYQLKWKRGRTNMVKDMYTDGTASKWRPEK
jgi:hypothetical protein